MRNILYIFIFITSGIANSQQPDSENAAPFNLEKHCMKIDSLVAINWLTYSYKYLDKDFKISISNAEFQEGLAIGNFYPERIRKHTDSLAVILYKELRDWQAVNIASFRITYSWQRLGWFQFLNKNEAQQLFQNLGFKHPYNALTYLKDESIQEGTRLAIIQNTRKKLVDLEIIDATNAASISDKTILDLVFKHNPERMALEQAAHGKLSKNTDKKD